MIRRWICFVVDNGIRWVSGKHLNDWISIWLGPNLVDNCPWYDNEIRQCAKQIQVICLPKQDQW